MGNSQLGQMMVRLAPDLGCTIVNMVSITSKTTMMMEEICFGGCHLPSFR